MKEGSKEARWSRAGQQSRTLGGTPARHHHHRRSKRPRARRSTITMRPIGLLAGLVGLSHTRLTWGSNHDLGHHDLGHQTWTMCRSSSSSNSIAKSEQAASASASASASTSASAASSSSLDCPLGDQINNARVPGTAFVNLLQNGTFSSEVSQSCVRACVRACVRGV